MNKIYQSSPFGTLEFVFHNDKLSALNIADASIEMTEREMMSKSQKQVTQQMQAYFDGTLRTFDVEIAFQKGTAFEQQVWTALLDIPYGYHKSYSDIAYQVGKDYKAARAIGRAVGQNPIAIIVPCHRVMGKNGKLTGFAWGIKRKSFLINLEQNKTIGIQGALF